MRRHFIMRPAALFLSGALLLNTSCGFLLGFRCVAKGALVETPYGPKPIETLEVDDTIYCFDEQSGERHETRITARRKATRECVRLKTSSGQELVVTSDHPVYDPVEGIYTNAGDWVLGERDTLWVLGNEETPFFHERISITEIDAGLHEVFDLSIEHELHNFVANGILVHNKDPVQPPVTTDSRCVGVSSLDSSTFGAFPLANEGSTQVLTIEGLEEAIPCTSDVTISRTEEALTVSLQGDGYTYNDSDQRQVLLQRTGQDPTLLTFKLGYADRVAYFDSDGDQELESIDYGSVGEKHTVRLEFKDGEETIASIETINQDPEPLISGYYEISPPGSVAITTYTDTKYEYWEIEILEQHDTITLTNPAFDSTLTLRASDPEPIE